MTDGADLEHHHAHRVRDDVVQLARDPRTLLGDGDPCRRLALPLGEDRAHLRRLALPLGEARAHLRRLGLLGTLAEGVPGDPGDDEPQRNEDTQAHRLRAGMLSTTIRIPPSTIARPTPACLLSRRLPSRNAVASPTTPRLPMNGISSPSTNESALAMSQ